MADPLAIGGHVEPTVLFVDGDANAAASAALAVERSGEDVSTGIERTASGAIDRVDRGGVDCVVVTDGVPDGDVVSVVERIHEAFDGPVVVAPRNGDERLASAVVAAGADEYVPVGPDLRASEEGRLARRVRAAVDGVERPSRGSLLNALPAGVGVVHDGVVGAANARLARLLGTDRGSLRGTPLRDAVPESDREAVDSLLAAADADATDDPPRTVVGDGWSGPAVELFAQGFPGTDAAVVLGLDVGERRGRERRLSALHRTTREMVRSKRADDIAELAARTAVETLEPLAASVYVYDRADGELRRSATASSVAPSRGSAGGRPPAGGDADDHAWDVFVSGTMRHWRDGSADASGVGSRLTIPLGDAGVLVVEGATADAFSEADVEFARTLATNVEVALDRAHREATLLDRTDRLRERTETLDRLRRIDAVVRDIGQLLVRATGRSEIERAVCERLAAVDGWELAWVAERTLAGDGLDVRNRSGTEGYVDAITRGDPGPAVESPAWSALETGSLQDVAEVVAHAGADEWRELTLEYGLRSAVSIPLSHEGREYGVLEVYGDRADAFGDAERSVLGELGEMIAYAIGAVERERALLSDRGVGLEIRTGGADSFFARLATRVETRVTVDGVVPQSGGGYLVYLRVDDADADADVAGAVESVADRDAAVTGVRPLGDGDRFEVRLSDSPLFERSAAHGGSVRAVTAGGGDCTVRIELPVTVDVREFVAALRGEYPDLAVLAQRSPGDGSTGVEGGATDRLTERQREVLEVAFHSGFFEWPRDSTGEEIAARLDVSPPTFHKHVRTAERKVLDAVLGRPDP